MAYVRKGLLSDPPGKPMCVISTPMPARLLSHPRPLSSSPRPQVLPSQNAPDRVRRVRLLALVVAARGLPPPPAAAPRGRRHVRLATPPRRAHERVRLALDRAIPRGPRAAPDQHAPPPARPDRRGPQPQRAARQQEEARGQLGGRLAPAAGRLPDDEAGHRVGARAGRPARQPVDQRRACCCAHRPPPEPPPEQHRVACSYLVRLAARPLHRRGHCRSPRRREGDECRRARPSGRGPGDLPLGVARVALARHRRDTVEADVGALAVLSKKHSFFRAQAAQRRPVAAPTGPSPDRRHAANSAAAAAAAAAVDVPLQLGLSRAAPFQGSVEIEPLVLAADPAAPGAAAAAAADVDMAAAPPPPPAADAAADAAAAAAARRRAQKAASAQRRRKDPDKRKADNTAKTAKRQRQAASASAAAKK